MKQEDIDKLLACRAAIDKHKDRDVSGETFEKHDKSTLEYLKVLNDNGFADASAFEIYNDMACYDEWRDKTVIVGECDNCEGYKDDPPCLAQYGAKACFNVKQTTEQIYRYMYTVRRKRKFVFAGDCVGFPTKKGHYGGCPEGHGWHYKDGEKRIFAFDIDWKVS